ncbi:hypothetical protein [Pseudarthrobacter sulfonivorans]|uniref:hypothetical protein n=1 Tax=Pseudarthrobacter sulfonivorans TaxID=121292 RepID=UPI0028556FFD|nr:hypothetical protein [Pseudarthrobacter sulfonivorans]
MALRDHHLTAARGVFETFLPREPGLSFGADTGRTWSRITAPAPLLLQSLIRPVPAISRAIATPATAARLVGKVTEIAIRPPEPSSILTL